MRWSVPLQTGDLHMITGRTVHQLQTLFSIKQTNNANAPSTATLGIVYLQASMIVSAQSSKYLNVNPENQCWPLKVWLDSSQRKSVNTTEAYDFHYTVKGV